MQRDLPDIKARCYVDSEGCWHWLGTIVRGIPLIQIQRKRYRVRRLVRRVFVNRFVYMTCGVSDCVNPAHIETRTRSEYVKATAKDRKNSYVTKRNAKSSTAKLDKEKAQQIRQQKADGASLRQLAKTYGVNHETIRNVVRNRTWREASPWAI